jgi:RHS repeat-associated protein
LELVGGAVDSATTYEPYGGLLVRTGASGTVYGFTGEQHDGAPGLLYLRARYYNPGLKVFMSVDPFPGWSTVPASQHGYNYVHNNPINGRDRTGLCAEFGDDACWASPLRGFLPNPSKRCNPEFETLLPQSAIRQLLVDLN